MGCGFNGFQMVQKNLKEISLMGNETAFGPLGMKMEIKNFKQHIKMVS